MSRKTGYGITETDRKKGIFSLEAKRENKCPLYTRMDKLFGEKPNVKPLDEICMNQTEFIHGVDGFSDDEENTDEEDEDEDDDDEEEEEEEAEEEDKEEQTSVSEDVEVFEEPSQGLRTLAMVALHRLEEGACRTTDIEREDSVSHGHEDDAGVDDDTFFDDGYQTMVDNNNANMGLEEVMESSDDDKENEPAPSKSYGSLKRPQPGSKATAPAKKVKTTTQTRKIKETAPVDKSEVTDLTKKLKARDPRKDPPTLNAGSAPQSRNAFATAYMDASTNKIESQFAIL